MPSPIQITPPLPPPKLGAGPSPGRQQGTYMSSDAPMQSDAHIAHLSVYRSPGPAVSAELVFPTTTTTLPDGTTQSVTFTKTTVQDLASRFPLNEDVLTSASSSTLAPGTGRSATIPVHSSPQQGRSGEQFVNHPSRQTGHIPPESYLTPNWAPVTQPKQQMSRPSHEENDIPIPIPPPRAASAAPSMSHFAPSHGIQTDGHPSANTNGPTFNVSQYPTRPQATPLQAKPLPEPVHSGLYAPSKNLQSSMQQNAPAVLATTTPTLTNHSPSRSLQQSLKGSPGGNHANSLANVTPKQSPSNRLQTRNGSTDTVQNIPSKSSPNYASRTITTNANTNTQANVSLRPEVF